jgi:hypothetical protein
MELHHRARRPASNTVLLLVHRRASLAAADHQLHRR